MGEVGRERCLIQAKTDQGTVFTVTKEFKKDRNESVDSQREESRIRKENIR